MSAITTHVLDTSTGRPASGVDVQLETARDDRWTIAGRGQTDDDGRLRTLLPPDMALASGTYRLVFDTAGYFRRNGTAAFHPRVIVEFIVTDGETHCHVPLLISPFGYTTYRGS